MDSLPFLIPVGIEYRGIIRFEPPIIVVEFSKWSWRKWSKQLHVVRIPVSEVASIEDDSRMPGRRLNIQLRSMETAPEIPYSQPGLVQLQFAKGHRNVARQLTARLSAAIAEHHLEQLDGELRRMEE